MATSPSLPALTSIRSQPRPRSRFRWCWLHRRPQLRQRRRGRRRPPAPRPPRPPRRRHATEAFVALLSWIDGIGETGLDGHDLRELGLKDGSLTVDDARTGKRWAFKDISLSLERPHGGGIVITVGSSNPEPPWGLSAAITPLRDGSRMIELEGRHVA